MRLTLDRRRQVTLIDQAREQIVSALHAGLLKHGDRLPSLRQVASRSGVNVKTVMGVYTRLEDEGLLNLRRGSGAFVGAPATRPVLASQTMALMRLLKRHFHEAAGHDIPPETYLEIVRRFVTKDLLGKRSVVVLECNREQVRCFAREITERTGAKAHPVLLEDAAHPDPRTDGLIRSAAVVCVSDFHRKEAFGLAARYGKEVVELTLHRDFIPAILQGARRGKMAMLVESDDFYPAFRKALAALGLKQEEIDRIKVAVESDAAAVRKALAGAETVHVSPLCSPAMKKMLPRSARVLDAPQMLSDSTIEAIEASLILSCPVEFPKTPPVSRLSRPSVRAPRGTSARSLY